jgi:hypothetical protein
VNLKKMKIGVAFFRKHPTFRALERTDLLKKRSFRRVENRGCVF